MQKLIEIFLDFEIKEKDKKFIMEIIVHASDISNPSKPWDTCKEWTLRVVKEFFDQVTTKFPKVIYCTFRVIKKGNLESLSVIYVTSTQQT